MEKVMKVLESCATPEQLRAAMRFKLNHDRMVGRKPATSADLKARHELHREFMRVLQDKMKTMGVKQITTYESNTI